MLEYVQMKTWNTFCIYLFKMYDAGQFDVHFIEIRCFFFQNKLKLNVNIRRFFSLSCCFVCLCRMLLCIQLLEHNKIEAHKM